MIIFDQKQWLSIVCSNLYSMKTKQPDDPAISAPVLEMLTVANEYCLFFEKTEGRSMPEILDYFHRIGPLLYLKGSLLPAIESEDAYPGERFVTEEEWESMFKTLREIFQGDDIYYFLDHNHDSREESLSDNLSDIYQDMKDFTLLYQKNTHLARLKAIQFLRELFPVRWGLCIIKAMGAAHQLLFREAINPDLLADDRWINA